MNFNMKRIQYDMEHSILIQNANAESMNAFMTATNSRLEVTMAGVSNNSKAITEIQDNMTNLLKVIANNDTGLNAIYRLSKLTPELIALIRRDISLLRDVRLRVLDFERGIFNLINGRLSPELVPAETLMKGLEKIKGMVYENLHGLKVRYEHPIFYYSQTDPVYALQGNQVMVNIEIPLSQDDDTYKVYEVNHIGSPITFANTSEFHVSTITNLPAAIAISDDNSKYIELSERELSACKGRDILTCPGAIAYRALSPKTCAAAIWLKNNMAVEEHCDFIYQNRPFRKDHMIKIDSSRYALFTADRTANIVCPGHPQRVVQLNGLSVIQLGCGCSISTTGMVLPPQVSACKRKDLVTNVEYPINAAILLDLAEAGQIPDTLLKEGSSLQPWAVAYKPPKYKAADTNILANHKVKVDDIQRSLRENRPLHLPNFDETKSSGSFSTFTTIPSVTLGILFIIVVALIFYRYRHVAMIFAALSNPPAVKGYVFKDPTPCPAVPQCATVQELWGMSSMVLILPTILLVSASLIAIFRIIKKRALRNKTQVFLQVSIGAISETVLITSFPFPATRVTRSNAEIIGCMQVRKTSFKQYVMVNWVSTLRVDNCFENNTPVAYKLPNVIQITNRLAKTIYNSSPDTIMIRLLVSDGTVATLVPLHARDDSHLGWVPLEPPRAEIQA